jgi:hypothetical protein
MSPKNSKVPFSRDSTNTFNVTPFTANPAFVRVGTVITAESE